MKRFFPMTKAVAGYPVCFLVQADSDPMDELRSIGANCFPFDGGLSAILSEAIAGEASVFRGWTGIVLGTEAELQSLQEKLESIQWQRWSKN